MKKKKTDGSRSIKPLKEMPDLKGTTLQKKLAINLAKGMTQVDAAREAGYSITDDPNQKYVISSRLSKKPAVVENVRTLLLWADPDIDIKLLNLIEHAYELAMQSDNVKDVLATVKLLIDEQGLGAPKRTETKKLDVKAIWPTEKK